jgi:hypothetical protein
MSDLKIVVPGAVFLTELATTQVPVASGAGTFSATNNIATITFAGAHGLTFTPAAGTAPNFFVQFTGFAAQTGVGTLNGPIFRILAIPSATTIQIYTTVTAATFTAGTAIPVFIPTGAAIVGSVFSAPQVTVAAGAITQGPLQASAWVNMNLGANCVAQYNPDNTSIIQDSTTGNTLAVAPTFRTMLAASTGGQLWIDGAGASAIFASGSAGTSRFSVVE